ncbi:twin-arginine translocase subunit TatB [Corynebacterium aquatimens]|uniref:Sec-independent protein translocase protein TatB n=1 Tax=Corynebacterium TaxID=1716 RepID=UPI001F1BFF1E|nr:MULTISPECIES: Sec-independent protein translocase protein TatB [Corynebacterium]QYH19925.1 twin-arginine translocase subunit TatB [Corynebacterium aquatimens]UIZ92908.1 twin-arginine translocase subunit TatB [Corynebacterium sp. CNCTC7651]
MFSSFGWVEFFVLLILGLIVIGPERLPGVIEDVRAAIYAARKAINNAKQELNGELDEFEEFRKPLDTVSKYAAMGPARAMSSLLFDGDEDYLNEFDPRRVLADEEPGRSGPRPGRENRTSESKKPQAGFSWEDVL